MDLPINPAPPRILHIDLNSCFATIEQQASPRLRGKPLAIAAYDSDNGCILSPSIEAKALGIKTGMRVGEGRQICPDLIVMTPDPPKYRDVHDKFMTIFRDYSPSVIAKSIDEAIIDLYQVPNLVLSNTKAVETAQEIKSRIRHEIGEWIKCSIGIGPNRFLAKVGSDFKKPDGLTVIDKDNIRFLFGQMKLTDLCGISFRFKARLNRAGIFDPVQFLDAPHYHLASQVFHGIGGYYWYSRLRGWEVDQNRGERKTFGQSYALPRYAVTRSESDKILMKLCEKMGRRLRADKLCARGIYIAYEYERRYWWGKGEKTHHNLHTTIELFDEARLVSSKQPATRPISKISVACFDLATSASQQISLFDNPQTRNWQASSACDSINDRYGEFTITPATMLNTSHLAIDRIAFGK